MSTLTGQGARDQLKSEEDLAGYFQSFAKCDECFRIGLEAEFFPVDRRTGKALPYDGDSGIHAILKTLAERFSYKPILESGNVIALKRDELMITLEPGGQMELSAPPVLNAFQIEQQVEKFRKELHGLADRFPNAAWLAVGIHPFSPLDEISWVPKQRYRIMAEHFKTHGALSHEMMKRTATNQVNVDYRNEEDAMANLRAALGITSIVSAMFANSSFSDGKPNGFLTKRMAIWRETDPDRSGLIVQFTRPGLKFRDYLNYLLDMPLIFIVRGDKWIPIGKMTFRQFIKKGYEGQSATLGDFELHLSTAFPEVRIKQYLEVRGVDGQSPDLIPAVAAFWKGILYNDDAREAAWNLVKFASEEDRLRLHEAMPREGLKAKLGGKPILPIARELVEISCASLGKQKLNPEDTSECVYINRLRDKILRPGKSPAEILLEKWEAEFQKQPGRLIEFLQI